MRKIIIQSEGTSATVDLLSREDVNKIREDNKCSNPPEPPEYTVVDRGDVERFLNHIFRGSKIGYTGIFMNPPAPDILIKTNLGEKELEIRVHVLRKRLIEHRMSIACRFMNSKIHVGWIELTLKGKRETKVVSAIEMMGEPSVVANNISINNIGIDTDMIETFHNSLHPTDVWLVEDEAININVEVWLAEVREALNLWIGVQHMINSSVMEYTITESSVNTAESESRPKSSKIGATPIRPKKVGPRRFTFDFKTTTQKIVSSRKPYEKSFYVHGYWRRSKDRLIWVSDHYRPKLGDRVTMRELVI